MHDRLNEIENKMSGFFTCKQDGLKTTTDKDATLLTKEIAVYVVNNLNNKKQLSLIKEKGRNK